VRTLLYSMPYTNSSRVRRCNTSS